MEGLQPLSLGKQLLRGGDDDHHVHFFIGMMILIHDVVHIFRQGQRGAGDGGAGLRRIPRHGHIVEPHGPAAGHGERDGVDGSGIHRIFSMCFLAMVVGSHSSDGECTFFLSVDDHIGSRGRTRRDTHVDLGLAAAPIGIAEHDGLRLSLIEGLWIEDVAPATVPRESVDLIERMIIVGRGIMTADKGGRIHSQDSRIVLCEEIIAIVGIGIARALGYSRTAPAHWSFGIEHVAPADNALFHLLQVVLIDQLVGTERLALQVAAIAIDMHLVEVGESSLANHGIGELIVAGRRHSDLGPTSGSQHAVGGIAVGGTRTVNCRRTLGALL